MICGECFLARTNPNDDEDIYSCPFDLSYCFHSGEKCHYPKTYSIFLRQLRPFLNLYDKTVEARIELLDS